MKNGIFNSKIKGNKYYFLYFKNLVFSLKIIFLFFYLEITNERPNNLLSFFPEINLVVSGGYNQRFLGESFYLEPSEVIVNGISSESCKSFCDLEYEENNITLIFYDSVESCEMMFYYLDNIKEIDLSNFDFSHVTSMFLMFYNSHNIEKIIFGNANTSSVRDMRGVFYNCSILTSLNLSSFDTSQVTSMEAMFYIVPNLISIDLSNFNTTNVESLRLFF